MKEIFIVQTLFELNDADKRELQKNHSEDTMLPEKPKAGSTEKSETYKTKKPKNKTNIIAARTHNPSSFHHFPICNLSASSFIALQPAEKTQPVIIL